MIFSNNAPSYHKIPISVFWAHFLRILMFCQHLMNLITCYDVFDMCINFATIVLNLHKHGFFPNNEPLPHKVNISLYYFYAFVRLCSTFRLPIFRYTKITLFRTSFLHFWTILQHNIIFSTCTYIFSWCWLCSQTLVFQTTRPYTTKSHFSIFW